jgi:magnesium transporter
VGQAIPGTLAAAQTAEGMVWIGLYKPTNEEFELVAKEFQLPDLAVEDAIQLHQRPKIERYGDILFVVLRAARYVDRHEMVDFGEIHVFVGTDFIITIRHAENPDLGSVRNRLESEPELLSLGPEAVLYAIIDQVVDEYFPVVSGLENDVDEIEDEVFGGRPDVSRRIYELSREVITFQRSVKPLQGVIVSLRTGYRHFGVDQSLQDYLRDVEDHLLQVQEHVDAYRELLQNILTVNVSMLSLSQNDEVRELSEVAISQNEEVKKISAWAAILFAPTLIGTIYGMNFSNIPELDWRFGYPMALTMMVITSVTLYLVFRRRGWLT